MTISKTCICCHPREAAIASKRQGKPQLLSGLSRPQYGRENPISRWAERLWGAGGLQCLQREVCSTFSHQSAPVLGAWTPAISSLETPLLTLTAGELAVGCRACLNLQTLLISTAFLPAKHKTDQGVSHCQQVGGGGEVFFNSHHN